MPLSWYILGAIAFLIWACLIFFAAPHVPGHHGIYEFAGTMLTLFPVGLDMLRKFYVKRSMPSAVTDGWVKDLVQQVFLGYERLYAWCVFIGVSLIGLGFAMGLTHPGEG